MKKKFAPTILKLLHLIPLFFICCVPVFSQPQQIKGIVTDNLNQPLRGVSVTVQGMRTGVTTDETGTFVINVPGKKSNLVFSYVGFQTAQVVVGNQSVINVTLQSGSSKLTDVVVIGYGTQSKTNLTGAVDQIGSEYFENRPVPNVSRALQGTIPNLNLKLTDGKPIRNPTINIRGTTSIGAGGSALVLIDGVPGDVLNLNPEDIKSVTVLKDAASAAIYGSRGAFGVVLITTKTPGKSKTQLSYSASYSINQRTTNPDWVWDGYTWAKMFNESYLSWTDYVSAPRTVGSFFQFSPAYLDSLKYRSEHPGTLPEITIDPATGRYIYYGNTNWLNELYVKNIPSMDHSLSISGGSDKVDYVISGRYYKQDGVYRYNSDKFNKYNLRFKGGIQVTDWLKFTSNSDFSAYDYKFPLSSINQYDMLTNIKLQGFPMGVMFNPDGTLTQTAANSVGEFYYGKSGSVTKQTFFRNTVGFDASLIKNIWNAKGDFTYQNTNTEITKKLLPVPYSVKPGEISTAGTNYLNNSTTKQKYISANVYTDVAQSFGSHHLKALVGGNLEMFQVKNLEVQRDGLLLPDLPDFNLASGLNYKIVGGGNEWTTLGLFYRMHYDFKNKYLFDLNGRYDGSSKFPADQRFGFFPSVSVGWNVASENFMKGTRGWLNNLKLRSSYGTLGNGQISPYLYVEAMKAAVSNTVINGSFPTYIQNPAVLPEGFTWEKSTTLDFGADIDLLSKRLSVGYSWYSRKTTDMITVGQPLPAVFGASVPRGNYADLTTKGFELSSNWSDQIRTSKPINYSLRLTLSDNSSVIDKFYNPNNLLSTYYVGQRVGDIWGYVTEGLFTSVDDIKNHADQSFIVVSSGNKLLPGDIKFKDLNNDGKINNGKNTVDDHGDLTIIGNTQPRYTYGATTTWDWNNISISAFFQGVGKRNWYPSDESGMFWGQYARWYGIIPQHTLNGTWTLDNPNPDSYFPRYRGPVSTGGRELGVAQTRYLQNVSYIRLKDLTISYSLPKKLVSKIKVSDLRVYLSGQNLWTYSKMFKLTKDIDPEVIENSDIEIRSDINLGDGANYPMLKTYTVGIHVNFN